MALNIRRATPQDARAIAEVHVRGWHENYRGILSEEIIAQRTVERRVLQWAPRLADPDRAIFVACAPSGEVQGFAAGYVLDPPQHGYESFLAALYLIAGAKGNGTGRALLCTIAREFAARGCRSMALRVLRKNPARSFYERLGARLIDAPFPVESGEFDDVAYGFDDLSSLR